MNNLNEVLQRDFVRNWVEQGPIFPRAILVAVGTILLTLLLIRLGRKLKKGWKDFKEGTSSKDTCEQVQYILNEHMRKKAQEDPVTYAHWAEKLCKQQVTVV